MLGKLSGYVNPFSKEFNKATINFEKLSKGEKALTITLSVLAGIGTFFLLGIGGYATFKSLVDEFNVKKLEPNESSTADKIEVLAEDFFQEMNPSTSLPKEFTQLNENLREMQALGTRNERSKEIEKMTFADLSRVVLQTRNAIIEKVQRDIPKDADVLFLIGGTGSGKSTTLCFLRGDQMVLNGFNYDSENDKAGLIGHSIASSSTFLPNVSVEGKLAIVDFPGFEDTKGELVSLGIECAFIALGKEYQPKILVVESITNDEGRYKEAAALGKRLDRLLNKENCTLGITKYFLDPDYGKIQEADEKALNNDEASLIKEIEYKSNLYSNPLIPQKLREENLKVIDEKKQQLKKLQQDRAQEFKQQQDTFKKNIEEKEKEMTKQIGLENVIRFDKLENRIPFLETLAKKNAVSVNETARLDENHKQKITKVFNHDLMEKMGAAADFDRLNLMSNINKSSLVDTLFPEIGKFLHLPEMDPQIVRNFDKQFIDATLLQCENFMILAVDSLLANQTIDGELGKKLDQKQDYVMRLCGVDIEKIKTAEDKKTQWEKLKRNHFLSSNDELTLSPFIQHLATLSEIPNKQDAEQIMQSLNKLPDVISKLKNIGVIMSFRLT